MRIVRTVSCSLSTLLVTAALAVLPGTSAQAAESVDTTADQLLAALTVAPSSSAGYDRDLFPHWIDADGDGCDTRSEVLQAESTVGVTYGSGCTVATGSWTSPYDGVTWTEASDVDIDHVVALGEAWASGADRWTTAQRRAYANDLDVSYALVAVTDEVNQSKGDRDPAQWLPPSTADRCSYVQDWVQVKYRWRLAVDTTERAAVQAVLGEGACGSQPVEVPSVADVPGVEVRWPLRTTAYDGVIFELVDGTTPQQLSFERWRDVYGYETPGAAPTDYVKYPWSSTIYAVTFWPGSESAWLWRAISYPEWQRAGFPAPRNAGWIVGSSYYRWATSGELFVRGQDGSLHKLSYADWQASGFRSYETRSNLGFQRLTWDGTIAAMSDVGSGQGGPISYDRWAGEAFPSPLAVQRFPGDQFYRDACSSSVVYAGPTMNRAISYAEYVAAGSPGVRVDNQRSCGPTSPPPAQPPANPGDTKNCTDFRTWAEANAWFQTYYPYYRDVAKLDGNNDGIPCETLPGHP